MAGLREDGGIALREDGGQELREDGIPSATDPTVGYFSVPRLFSRVPLGVTEVVGGSGSKSYIVRRPVDPIPLDDDDALILALALIV